MPFAGRNLPDRTTRLFWFLQTETQVDECFVWQAKPATTAEILHWDDKSCNILAVFSSANTQRVAWQASLFLGLPPV